MRYFKSLIPTFGPFNVQWVNMIKECLPKVGNKLVSHVRILFLVSLLFAAVINPYSVFKF